MSDTGSEPPVRNFPFVAAATDAFDLVRARFAAFVGAVAGWVVAQFAVFLVCFWGIAWLLQANAEFATAFANLSPRSQDALFEFVPSLFSLVAAAAIAVNWHRFAILGEQPRGLLPFHAVRTALYAWRLVLTLGIILIFVMLSVPIILMIVNPARLHPSLQILFNLVPLGILLFTLLVLLRTGLALPGAAIGDRKWTLEYSWHQTDGNSWRLLGGFLMIMLPFYALSWIVRLMTGDAAEHQELVLFHVGAAVSYGLGAVGVTIAAGYYSQAFTFFSTDGRDRPPASEFV